MKQVQYKRFNNLIPLTLDSLYEGNQKTYNDLKQNIKNVIEVEAPVTLNTLKARLREAFGVAKISQKALDIINEILADLHVIETDNLFETVLWPASGIFDMDAFRVNSERLIYDIPYQEMIILFREYELEGEALYREILAYFNLQVLTKKAENYLSFVESKL